MSLCAVALAAPSARAQRDATSQAFERMEESLQPRVEEGDLSPRGIGPVLLVGATPAFEETRAWFPVAALESLTRTFGNGNVRACEACMNPRVTAVDGRLVHNTVLSMPEIAQIDGELRGKGAPARSAVWMEETPGGIAVRIIRIDNGQVLFAGNFDGQLKERSRTAQLYNYTLELGRRLRGESLTHIFIDFGLLPGQHITFEVAEQFGENNKNLFGVLASAVDPVLGLGASYYRVIPLLWDFTIGGQVIVSIPTAVATAVNDGQDPGELIDPLITGVLVARFPIPRTNFAIVGTASTNLSFSVGFSLLNISFLPFLP